MWSDAFRLGLRHAATDIPEAALGEKLAEARRTWPAVGVDEEAFLTYWGQHIEPDEPLPDAISACHAADLYLACGCVRGDQAALQELDRLLETRMPVWLQRVDRSPHFLDEVRQVVRVRLLADRTRQTPRMADYSGRGALAAWLRVTAVHAALNLRRSEHRDTPLSDVALATEHPELDYLKQLGKPSLDEAFRSALAGLSTRERNLLRLHYLDGMSTPEMAALFRTHRTTVRRQLNDCHEKLREAVRHHLQDRLKLGDSSVDSLLRSPDALDLSLTAFMADLDEAGR